jgi:hypothetical protein
VNERKKPILAWAIVGAVVGTGVVVLTIGLLAPVTFGWFAYQPLADATFVPGGGGLFLSSTAIIGGVILMAGLLAGAFLAGRRVAGAKPRRLNSSSEE